MEDTNPPLVEVIDIYPDPNFQPKGVTLGAGTVSFDVPSWGIHFNHINYRFLKNKKDTKIPYRSMIFMPIWKSEEMNAEGKTFQRVENRIIFEDKEKWKKIVEFVANDITETLSSDLS